MLHVPSGPMEKRTGGGMRMFITVPDLSAQMHVDNHTIYEWAGRSEDPLPLFYKDGNVKSGVMLESELEEWWKRNRVHYKDRRKRGK